MKEQQFNTKVEKQVTMEAVADTLRKSIFIGFNSIGFGAAGYLIIMAILTIQTGGSIHGY